MLARHPGRVVTRHDLMREARPDRADEPLATKTLGAYVYRLRLAMRDDPVTPRYIATVPRVGYRLEVDALAPWPPEPAEPPALPRGPLWTQGQLLYDAGGTLIAVAMTATAADWLADLTTSTARTRKDRRS